MAVVLPVPDAWHQEIEQKDGMPPLKVTFSDPGDMTWEFLVSAMWRAGTAGPDFDAGFVRAAVEASGMRALPESVESAIDLKEMAGATAKGYYFRVTDRRSSLPAGEYKYMMQGMAGLGSIALSFTLFSNSDDPAQVDRSLAVVQGATVHRRP